MIEIATFAAIAFACGTAFLLGYAVGETRAWLRFRPAPADDEAPGDVPRVPHHGGSIRP